MEVDYIAQARLKAAGQRYTGPRRAIVSILAACGGPMAIHEILYDGAELVLSSTYRNLAVLERAGVVHRIATSGGEFDRYELAEDLTDHHHHLMCRQCGTITDVRVPVRLEQSLAEGFRQVMYETGFHVENHRLDLVGMCDSCFQTHSSDKT